jgi:ATP-binding cassette subfamily B protein
MGREIDPARVRAAIRDFGLENLAGRFVAGIGEGGRTLSEGERQLVSLARLAVGDPGLVVLDEATSALDPATERRVKAALDRALAGRTAVVIAHRLSTLEDCRRIVVLHHGEVAETGTHADLVARGDLYAKLWRLYTLEERLSSTEVVARA